MFFLKVNKKLNITKIHKKRLIRKKGKHSESHSSYYTEIDRWLQVRCTPHVSPHFTLRRKHKNNKLKRRFKQEIEITQTSTTFHKFSDNVCTAPL